MMPFAPIPGVVVIGLGHRARHGKDTVAAAICAAIPGAQRFAFADDLYAVARICRGMTTKDAPLLQALGVEYRETVGPDVWVRSVFHKMQDARPRLAVITDVRFPNEFAFVRALGGVTVRVTRYDEHGSVFIDPSRDPGHVSEIALTDAAWDRDLRNDGPLRRLQDAAVALAHEAIATRAAVTTAYGDYGEQ